jgi:hypothetical protein
MTISVKVQLDAYDNLLTNLGTTGSRRNVQVLEEVEHQKEHQQAELNTMPNNKSVKTSLIELKKLPNPDESRTSIKPSINTKVTTTQLPVSPAKVAPTTSTILKLCQTSECRNVVQSSKSDFCDYCLKKIDEHLNNNISGGSIKSKRSTLLQNSQNNGSKVVHEIPVHYEKSKDYNLSAYDRPAMMSSNSRLYNVPNLVNSNTRSLRSTQPNWVTYSLPFYSGITLDHFFFEWNQNP